MKVKTVQSAQEAGPVLFPLFAPGYLGQGGQPWVNQVFHILGSTAEFRPQRTLDPLQQLTVTRFPFIFYRLILVYILQGIVSKIGERLEPLGTLVTYQVEGAGGGEYKRMSQFGSFQCSFAIASPAIDYCPLGKLAVGELVPAHHGFSFSAHVTAYPFHEVSL